MPKFLRMQFPSPVSLQWIADFIQAKLVGNIHGEATGINEIHKVEKGDLVFVDHPKYYNKCLQSAASFIIINKINHHVFQKGGTTSMRIEEIFSVHLPFPTAALTLKTKLPFPVFG